MRLDIIEMVSFGVCLLGVVCVQEIFFEKLAPMVVGRDSRAAAFP